MASLPQLEAAATDDVCNCVVGKAAEKKANETTVETEWRALGSASERVEAPGGFFSSNYYHGLDTGEGEDRGSLQRLQRSVGRSAARWGGEPGNGKSDMSAGGTD